MPHMLQNQSQSEESGESGSSFTARFFKAAAISTFLTSIKTGASAATGALGADILHKAGWIAANGAPIVSVGEVAAASAAGAATLYGPIICSAFFLAAFAEYNLDSTKTRKASLAGAVVLSAAAGAIGAAELGLSGTELGYIAAATATGSVSAACGAVILACCYRTFCAEACSADKASRSENTEPTLENAVSTTSAAQPSPSIMG